MKKIFCIVLLSCLILAVAGCNFFDKNPSSTDFSSNTALPNGNASVTIKMVVPGVQEGTPVASIRGSVSPTVTFKLIIGNPGNRDHPIDVIVKHVTVSDTAGSAAVTFSSLPIRPIVVQVSILNGNYQGYANFHGAADLKDNFTTVVEVAPAGSRLLQDVLAHAAFSTFNSSELMATANLGLIQAINNQVSLLDLNLPEVYSEALNKAIEAVRPLTQTYFALSADKKSLLGFANGEQAWTKTTTSLFTSADLWNTTIADMSIKRILRQPIGETGYVAWKHDSSSKYAIGAITTSGVRSAFVKNPGLCDQIQVLADGSLIVGGINEDKGTPVLFRWSGKANATTFSTAGAEQGLTWFQYFSGHLANATVRGIQFDGDQTLLVTVDNPVKVYRVSLDGVIANPTPVTPNIFPSVTLTSPVANSKYETGSTVTFSATASDADGKIAKVSFYAGDTLIGEDSASAYSLTSKTLATGTYVAKAVATDDKGAQTVSLPITFTVTGPVIASPTYASAIMGNTEATIRWPSVSKATSYNIYYSNSAGVSKTNGTKLSDKTSPFLHTNLTNGTPYYYVVTAVDAVSESEVSVEASATPLAPIVSTTQVDMGGGVSMSFVSIPHGSFVMGQADGSYDEKPTRTVTLTKDFYMGKYEVTQSQYQKVMGENPSYYTPANSYADNSNQPVEQVNWYDAIRFCNALSVSQNRTPCYTLYGSASIPKPTNSTLGEIVCDWNANGYRLPTEAEWEYSCHAGTSTKYSWGDADDEATLKANCWCAYNAVSPTWGDTHVAKEGTQAVGQKAPNPWGLYDMHGNVIEWCWDAYKATYYADDGNTVDPTGLPMPGLYMVYKGGSFGSTAPYLRIADRPGSTTTYTTTMNPLNTNRGKGFRIIRAVR